MTDNLRYNVDMTTSETPVALITGAGVRLGRASALLLAQEGYDIVVHYNSSSQPAEETVDAIQQMGQRAHLVQADLSTKTGIEKLAEETRNFTPSLSVLLNNAAIFYPSRKPEDWIEHWDHFQMVNLKSPFLLTVNLLEELRTCQGCVVNIVDIWARFPLKRFLPYSVAKAGLEALTKSLALELAPSIRVNGVAPGAALPASGSDGNTDKMLTQVPMGRLGGAESIAHAVLHLCQAKYVTGQILTVDGGRSINL